MGDCTVYWNSQPLQEEKTRDGTDEITSSSVSVSKNPRGFVYVLARPAGADRTVALTLDSNPEPGVYEFRPPYSEFEFSVRLEYADEPYPKPRMHVVDVTTPLSAAEPDDQIEIGLRKAQADSPGTKSIQGHITQLMDFSGLVPDTSDFVVDSLSPAPVLSILVSLSDEAPSSDMIKASNIQAETRLPPIGDSFGTLDVVGSDQPLNLQWEGKRDTPALQVEFVRINPGQESELTVENDSLPEVQFDDLAAHSQDERISILDAALSNALDRPVAEDTLAFFAAVVDELPRERTLTVHYDSSRSENTLTKSGTFAGTASVYYAEENRARHQLRFSGSDGYFYILLDPANDTTTPANVYSTSLARHSDTDLGPLVDFELSD